MQWPFIITCICLLASVGSKAVADEALVLHYTFDTDTGERAKDRSSYGNDGKIVKGQYLTEYNGRRGVLRLDGEKSVLNCPNSDSLFWSGDISFEAWVRQNGPIDPEGRGLASLFEANYFHFSVVTWYQLMSGFGTVDPVHGRETFLVPVTRSILSDKWAHIAMVVEYPRWRYYRNGELVRDAYMPIPLLPSRRSAKQIGVTSPIDLDEVRLYRRALTPAEIAAHARSEEVSPGRQDELAVEPHWYEDTVNLRLSCKGSDYAGHRAEMTLLNGDGTHAVAGASTPLKEAFEGSGRFVGTVRFPLSSLEGKSLDGVASILAPDGKLINKVYCHASLKKPDWVHTQEGYSDEVLAPWTPVEAQTNPDGAVEVRVWGRRHTFGTTLFPRQIETRGKEILAAPIALGGRVDGKPIAWKEGRVNLTDATKTEASIEQIGADDPLMLRIDTSVEYDGYMIFDCEVKARRDMSLEELTLEIPLRTRHATLCYDGRQRWHGGAVRGDMAFRFSPTIWLGDEQLGLCWQAESDEDWRYGDQQKAIEILPRGQTTIFRANLASVPTYLAMGQALHYKFALQATPIKPMLRDAWDLRIARHEPFGRALDLPDWKVNGKPMLQYYAEESGVRHLYILASDMLFYPMPVHKKFAGALHRLMDKAHVYGLKVYAYAIHERFPVDAPEFDINGLHMSKRPLSRYHGNSWPPGFQRVGAVVHKYGADSQGSADFCDKSKALQDANIHSLAKLLDEYGMDGVYLDGTAAHIGWCQNMLHGCGYRTKDGSIRQTSPVFAKRQFIKRIYTAVKQRRPDGVVDLHCSFGYNTAVAAYSDMMWTGEHWGRLEATGGVVPCLLYTSPSPRD